MPKKVLLGGAAPSTPVLKKTLINCIKGQAPSTPRGFAPSTPIMGQAPLNPILEKVSAVLIENAIIEDTPLEGACSLMGGQGV